MVSARASFSAQAGSVAARCSNALTRQACNAALNTCCSFGLSPMVPGTRGRRHASGLVMSSHHGSGSVLSGSRSGGERPSGTAQAKRPELFICNPGRSGGDRGPRIYRDTEIPQKIATFSQLFFKFSRLFSNFCSIPAIAYIFPPSRKKSAKFSTKNHRFAERSAKFCKNPKFLTKSGELTRKSAKFENAVG